MARVIYKYEITLDGGPQTITMKEGAQILSVDEQRGKICLWALVEIGMPDQDRQIQIIPTGETIEGPVGGWNFLGTVKLYDGMLIFHVFDQGVANEPEFVGSEAEGE